MRDQDEGEISNTVDMIKVDNQHVPQKQHGRNYDNGNMNPLRMTHEKTPMQDLRTLTQMGSQHETVQRPNKLNIISSSI